MGRLKNRRQISTINKNNSQTQSPEAEHHGNRQQAKQHSHRCMQKFRARARSIHKAAHPKQCTVL